MSSSLADDNSNLEDSYQEKLDFEENELLEENSVEFKPDASPISLSSNGSLESSTENLSLADKKANDGNSEDVDEKRTNSNDKDPTVVKEKNIKNNEEEGEVGDEDSDDDLEDGELKDDDPVNQSLDSLVQKNNNNKLKDVLCKFYTNGACTWGDNCRFKHCDLAKSNNQINNYTNQSNPNRPANQKYYQNKPQYNKYNNNTSNNYATEHDNRVDFDYETNSSRRTGDYERKRRLALESAPSWNDYSNQDYDNQRPYSKGNFSGGRNYSKNYDAYDATASGGGKYAQADSFHSDRSSSSFSDFSSEKSFKETSPPGKRSKHDSYEMDPHISSTRNHQHSKRDNRDYNKWKNDDDNNSTSSYFTESESLDGLDRKYQKRRTAARSPIPSSNLRRRSRSTSRRKESYYHYSRENSKTLDKDYLAKSSHSNNSSNSHNRSVEEKKPIKMTFLRKQQSLKNVKLANPKDEFESDEEIENSDERNESPYNKNTLEPKITDTTSSREELLKRLKEIDEAISRKRAKKA